MTTRARVPTRRTADRHRTSYERGRVPDAFDYDALSDMDPIGVWPNLLSDVEDPTILHGLADQYQSSG